MKLKKTIAIVGGKQIPSGTDLEFNKDGIATFEGSEVLMDAIPIAAIEMNVGVNDILSYLTAAFDPADKNVYNGYRPQELVDKKDVQKTIDACIVDWQINTDEDPLSKRDIINIKSRAMFIFTQMSWITPNVINQVVHDS